MTTPNAGADAELAVADGVQNGIKNGVAKTNANPTPTEKKTPDYAASLGERLSGSPTFAGCFF